MSSMIHQVTVYEMQKLAHNFWSADGVVTLLVKFRLRQAKSRKTQYVSCNMICKCRGSFTLPLWDPPCLIITGNCQGNMKLN